MNRAPAQTLRCAAAAIFIVVAATSASADTHDTVSNPVTIEGVLTEEGVTCPALRGDDGELYTFAGDIGELGPGQRVRVTGEVAEASICIQGTTIGVDDIFALL